MTDLIKKPWFSRKKQGIGWGLPVTWQGWTVLLSYILLSVAGPFFFSETSFQIPLFLTYFAAITIVFVAIVWKKGERLTP